MNHWDAMIDASWFGLVAGYLASERSPIDTILHVRDREMLAEVADCLDKATGAGGPAKGLPEALQTKVQEGSIKISTRSPNATLDPQTLVDPRSVRREAGCEVIYAPPFYVVHTPGLFEGKVMKNSPTFLEHGSRGQGQTATIKRQTKEHDHGHSH